MIGIELTIFFPMRIAYDALSIDPSRYDAVFAFNAYDALSIVPSKNDAVIALFAQLLVMF